MGRRLADTGNTKHLASQKSSRLSRTELRKPQEILVVKSWRETFKLHPWEPSAQKEVNTNQKKQVTGSLTKHCHLNRHLFKGDYQICHFKH